MVWHWTGHKPLSEPMMDQFTDAKIDESKGGFRGGRPPKEFFKYDFFITILYKGA